MLSPRARLKFLVDESTGREGHDAVYAGRTMPGAPDRQILAHAYAEGRILVTNDKDFGERVYRSREPHAGVILLRLKDVPKRRIAVLRRVIADLGLRLPNRFTVATESKVRIRPGDHRL